MNISTSLGGWEYQVIMYILKNENKNNSVEPDTESVFHKLPTNPWHICFPFSLVFPTTIALSSQLQLLIDLQLHCKSCFLSTDKSLPHILFFLSLLITHHYYFNAHFKSHFFHKGFLTQSFPLSISLSFMCSIVNPKFSVGYKQIYLLNCFMEVH